jgi:diguanylate cyclase (GGDEF)-like protein
VAEAHRALKSRVLRADPLMQPVPATSSMTQLDPGEARRVLDAARRRHYEDNAGALEDAIRCEEVATRHDDDALRGRALTLQAAVMLQRGDLTAAFQRVAAAEPHTACGDDRGRAELASVKAHLSFFAGAYAESLLQAEQAIELADRLGEIELRLFARRSSCLVFGNVGVVDWGDRLADLLQLSIEAGNRWEQALSRNDVAHFRMVHDELDEAAKEIERAFALAEALAPDNRFALGVLHCTRGEIRLRAGRPMDALEDTRSAEALLRTSGDPNLYVLAMSVVVQVQALLALGRLDDAERSGHDAVSALGERVPHARSMILNSLATALKEAGRIEAAFEALSAGAEIERRAFAELSELQRGLSVLERRTAELEAREEMLREQADRDWLTGLHNRRFLARELGRHAAADAAGPFSLAVLDLDHFKSINDRYGHDAGDRVLMRVAALLLGEMREQDAVVRTGGEEFVLVMPHTGARAAIACCERLREAIQAEPWDRIAAGAEITASVGVATADDASDLSALAARADRRLYEAKRAGRDRVVAHA